MKNQRGFIQIPLLIAIIAGVLVLEGIGYFRVKQYQNSQSEKQVQEIATEDSQAVSVDESSEIEKLKKEVEELKKSQAKRENAQPPVTEVKKSFSTAEIVASNKKFVVNVMCQTGNGNVYGSGIVIGKSQGNLIVITNFHITEYAKVPPAGVPPCVIGVPSLPEYYYGQPIFYPSIASENLMKAIDFSFIEVKEHIPFEITYYDEGTGKLVETTPATPKTTFLLTNTFPKICSKNLLGAGEEIVILGYPTIGEDLGLLGLEGSSKLITTEGIISSDIRSFDNYFVSSAKIEQGNSGGGAFLKSGNCLSGMPTYVLVGEIESLGRLINMPKLKTDYLSKIFIGI